MGKQIMISPQGIESRILLIRGQKVMLDTDLARKLDQFEQWYDG